MVSAVVEFGGQVISPIWSAGRVVALVIFLLLLRVSTRATAGFEASRTGMIVTTAAWIAGMVLYTKGVEFVIQRACHQ